MSGLLAWLYKLIGGWIPVGTKPFPEWLGKILWAIGIYLAMYFVMAAVFPPKPVVQNIGTQNVQQAEPRDMMGAGCNMMRGYIKGGIKAK
jgi:hypothetical protein